MPTELQVIELPSEKWDALHDEMRARFESTGERFQCNPVKDSNREIIGWDFPTEDGKVIRVGPTFYPWVAHERNTWPHRYMTTKVPMTLRIWNQRRRGEPEYTDKPLPIGTRVKIVMASRFGDVGITDDLTAENGYHARIPLDELNAKFEQFSMTA